MSMYAHPSKTQPLSKTIVTEFKIVVADLHLRSKHLTGSQAVRVPQDANFNNGDATATTDVPVVLNGVRVAVAVHSYEPFILDLVNASGTITGIACTGLFILYGALDSVVIKPSAPGTALRLTYVYA